MIENWLIPEIAGASYLTQKLALPASTPHMKSCPRALAEAIDNLYAIFSQYPLPSNTKPCPCCHSAEDAELLVGAPLKELQWEHLGKYSKEALMVWGDLECYKHFLPRIFELALTSGEWHQTPTPEAVFHILQYGEWRSWPQGEQQAIRKMLQAVWLTVRSNRPIEDGCIDVDQWLCCISTCEKDLMPYLEEWLRDESLSAAWALASLILCTTIAYTSSETTHAPPVWDGLGPRRSLEEWFKQPHRGAFWKYCETQHGQLQRWIKSSAVIEKLRLAEMSCGNVAMEREFRTAQECLREAPTTKFEPVYRKRRFQSAYWGSPSYRLY